MYITFIFDQISGAIKLALGFDGSTAVPKEIQFRGLQYALFSTAFVEVIGGVFFLVTAMYILRDKAKAEKAVAGKSKTNINICVVCGKNESICQL